MAEREVHPSTSSSSSSTTTHPSDSPVVVDNLNNHHQVPTSDSVLKTSSNGNIPNFPIMYPAFVPGLFPQMDPPEQLNRGPGLYAVHSNPYMLQPVTGFTPNVLIPFTYNIPTERSTTDIREAVGEQGQPGEQHQHQQAGPQRQVVVRRFQIAIQLDLMLILKLVAVIFLFNQDGSKQRLTLLVFFAVIVYLYQTGALAPVIRWLSQGMRRAAAPPQPPRPAGAARGQGDDNVGAEAQRLGENENEQVNDGNRAVENENAGEAGQGEAVNRWWIIVKEIQMIVFGFITSLLPGFHNIE